MNSTAKKPKLNEYEQQAEDFLTSTETTLDIVYLYTGEYFPGDKEKRDVYQFTLTNSKGSYSAKFGDSINNTNLNAYATGKKKRKYKEDYDFCERHNIYSKNGFLKARKRANPTSYDILACLELMYTDSFEDFCDEYGYSDQPIKEHDSIMQTYLAVKEQDRGLRRIFTEDQLSKLSEIA